MVEQPNQLTGNNMYKDVKVVRIKFDAVYKSQVEKYPELLDFYEQNTTIMPWKDDLYYSMPTPTDIEYKDWREMNDDKPRLKQYLEENPCYLSFTYTMEFEKYGDFDFKHHNKKLGYNVVDRFTTKVEYDFNLSDVNDHFMMVQNQILEVMKKQVDSIAGIGFNKTSGQHFNERCNVPVSDTFLHKVNQTMVLYDCCSDRLQEQIKKGWRIISVTPQPDQRRPDYVLGIVMDENEIKSVAEREEGVW